MECKYEKVKKGAEKSPDNAMGRKDLPSRKSLSYGNPSVGQA